MVKDIGAILKGGQLKYFKIELEKERTLPISIDIIPMNNKWNIKTGLIYMDVRWGVVFNNININIKSLYACPCLNKKRLFKVNVPDAYINVKYTHQSVRVYR